MRKVRSYQLLIIAVALIILNVFLPRTATNAIDSRSMQKVKYEQLHSVDPNLPNAENITTSISMVDKLRIFGSGNYVPVDADAALNLTQNEAVSLAKASLKQYINCGLIYEIPHIVNYVQPYLLIAYDNRELYYIAWRISLIGPANTRLNVAIDDETGIILAMEYHSDIRDSIQLSNEEIYNRLETISNVYFKSLGITNAIHQPKGGYSDLMYKIGNGADGYAMVNICKYNNGFEIDLLQ